MPFDTGLLNIRNFLRTNQKKAPLQGIFRVTVVAFEDRCNLNCGKRLTELLQQNSLFDVNYFAEPFSKGFLNLQGRNFFDFIDRGTKILEKTHSDILIWGYEEDGKIRLNFQIIGQYVIPNRLSFSLLDSLFIPISCFSNSESFSASLLLLLYGIIVAAIHPVTNVQKDNKPKILNDIISLLATDNSPKDLSREFIPYLMNMLGKVYLSNVIDNIEDKDITIIKNLLETALKNKQFMRLPIYYGCIYNNLGQLYELAFGGESKDNFLYLKQAIANYRDAQKILSRNYPYDYGLVAYHLALLYFEFWKHTNDLQALRDAVSQLREAEKVYSLAQFPTSWCHIEELLGYYLTSLGMSTKSNEIMLLAINSYKNQQKLYEQHYNPVKWAEIQEEIGHIYYLLGKQNDDDNFMLEARNYFHSAEAIYTDLHLKSELQNIQKRLAKVRNYID